MHYAQYMLMHENTPRMINIKIRTYDMIEHLNMLPNNTESFFMNVLASKYRRRLQADIIWVSHQSTSDVASPLMVPQLALQALAGVVTVSIAANSTLSPILFMPALSLDIHSSRVSVMSILVLETRSCEFCTDVPGELPWHTATEVAWKCFQHQDEEQRSKDRPLMQTHSNAKLVTVLTTDLHSTPGIGLHTMNDTHTSTLGLQRAHHSTFLGTRLEAFSISTKAK